MGKAKKAGSVIFSYTDVNPKIIAVDIEPQAVSIDPK